MFSNDSKGRIWKITKLEEKYADVQFSTSTKNKSNGEWETDFNANVRIIGKNNVDKIRGTEIPKGGIKVEIKRCGVTRTYDKDRNTNYERFLIFEYLLGDEPQEPTVNADSFMNIPDGDCDELPFN